MAKSGTNRKICDFQSGEVIVDVTDHIGWVLYSCQLTDNKTFAAGLLFCVYKNSPLLGFMSTECVIMEGWLYPFWIMGQNVIFRTRWNQRNTWGIHGGLNGIGQESFKSEIERPEGWGLSGLEWIPGQQGQLNEIVRRERERYGLLVRERQRHRDKDRNRE